MEVVTDKQIDEVYDAIDALIKTNSWFILEELCAYWEMKAWRIPLDLLVTYATTTLPVKSKIPGRSNFIKRCMQLHPEKNLWEGLE